jgi:micrococcal nuclease
MTLLLAGLALVAQDCGYSDYTCREPTYSSAGPLSNESTYTKRGVDPIHSPLLMGGNRTHTCRAVDDDTIACVRQTSLGSLRLRLNGLNAPEGSHKILYSLISGKNVYYTPLGHDRYGRTIAMVTAGRVNLNCYLVRNGYAAYVAKWDNRHALWNSCSYVRQNFRY